MVNLRLAKSLETNLRRPWGGMGPCDPLGLFRSHFEGKSISSGRLLRMVRHSEMKTDLEFAEVTTNCSNFYCSKAACKGSDGCRFLQGGLAPESLRPPPPDRAGDRLYVSEGGLIVQMEFCTSTQAGLTVQAVPCTYRGPLLPAPPEPGAATQNPEVELHPENVIFVIEKASF